MRALLVETELRLNGCAVNTEAVEAFACSSGQFHVLLPTVGVDMEGDLEMHAGDDLRVGELPDVDVVAADDAGEGLDVLTDLGDADVLRGGLQEDLGGGTRQGDGRLENNGCDEERYCRVGVELAGPVSQPDDQGGDNDADVSEGIANYMQDHGVHAHVGVIVAVAGAAGRLLGKSVVVSNMDTGVPALPLLG